jgi:hypothetical protein
MSVPKQQCGYEQLPISRGSRAFFAVNGGSRERHQADRRL